MSEYKPVDLDEMRACQSVLCGANDSNLKITGSAFKQMCDEIAYLRARVAELEKPQIPADAEARIARVVDALLQHESPYTGCSWSESVAWIRDRARYLKESGKAGWREPKLLACEDFVRAVFYGTGELPDAKEAKL